MLSYYLFLRRHFKPVFFGWLLTFFSSFGQTFLISIFVPFILADLALTKTGFGAYYASATVIASLFLLRFGHIIDEQPVRPFTYKTIALLAISCIGLALTWHVAMLLPVLIGLRLAGQGLMSHISMSVMSRHFTKNRGKALSISALGYSFGEMIFPISFGFFLMYAGWRPAAAMGAACLLMLVWLLRYLPVERMDLPEKAPTAPEVSNLPPVSTTGPGVADAQVEPPQMTSRGTSAQIGKLHNTEMSGDEPDPQPLFNFNRVISTLSRWFGSGSGKWTFYFKMMLEGRFWILSPPSFLISFTVTGFFFFQYIMADVKSWPVTVYATLFTGYGLVRMICSLYGGILTDRYSARNLYLWQLLPMMAGLFSLGLIPGIGAAVVFLFGTGVTIGLASVIKPAILAEMYGTERIGQVRSLYTVWMVMSTALAPLVFGYALDRGLTFDMLGVICGLLMLFATIHTLRLMSQNYAINPTG